MNREKLAKKLAGVIAEAMGGQGRTATGNLGKVKANLGKVVEIYNDTLGLLEGDEANPSLKDRIEDMGADAEELLNDLVNGLV